MANRWVCLSDKEIDLACAALESMVFAGPKRPNILLTDKLRKLQTRIRVASAKAKGRELQQWVCREIGEGLGIPYDQQDDQCPIHAREMGQAGVDVILRGSARSGFPFAVECKSTENFSPTEAIRQSRTNQDAGLDWLVVFRSKVVREPVALLDFRAFAKYVFRRG